MTLHQGIYTEGLAMERPSKWIGEKEVAQITGRGLQTLRNDRSKGQGIPYSKIGRLVRYSLADVVAFMESRKIKVDPL
jgi:predicted DNA-binding transcriptional regulator AlpA